MRWWLKPAIIVLGYCLWPFCSEAPEGLCRWLAEFGTTIKVVVVDPAHG
jgi:hypothetical protein